MRKAYQVNDSVIFSGKPIEYEEILNRMLKNLNIKYIDLSKEDLVK